MFLDKFAPRKPTGSRASHTRGMKGLAVICTMLLMTAFLWLVFGWTQARESAADQKLPRGETSKTKNLVQMSEIKMDQKKKDNKNTSPFYMALDEALSLRGTKLKDVCDLRNPVARRVLEDYGAMFLANETVLPPPTCVFNSQKEVDEFQNEAGFTLALIGGDEIELQPAAMAALLAAREEARKAGLDITPRDGTEAARRSFADTERLWATRFLPALVHWQKLGRLSREQVARLRRLSLKDQVREVLELEKSGIYFSTDFSKSILYSIAAPGTSQHIAMLALDVDQFANERVRRILTRHGWFQTVKSDLPHFTFLGLAEKDLPSRGLRSVKSGAQLFWIPNVKENDEVGTMNDE
ncbi:MAG TPA: hypothetical protein VF658_13180 [Pyrinomonadaceae bacterium]